MNRMILGAAAPLLFVTAAAANAQPVTAPYAALPVEITPHKVVPNADKDTSKLICQSEDQIGSRLGRHKTCMTAEQWKEKHREQREFADQMQAGARAPVSDDPAAAIAPPQ